MLNFLKPKKKFLINENVKKRIEKEIDALSKLKDGMFFKSKEFEIGFYINIIIDKRILALEINSEDKNIPDFVNFLLIVDSFFPQQPPKILTKTNFCFPSLMDGRDLSPEICKNWDKDTTFLEIANSIPKFIQRVLHSKIYNFYGKFQLGAIYDLKNFNNMLVNTFNCKFEKSITSNKNKNIVNEDSDYSLILSDDALILFENFENNPNSGKVVFWASLYAITDLQVNKMQKIASINFYNDENLLERGLKLKIDNILFFREALVRRMTNLKVKVEAKKLIKGQLQERRLTNREMNTMNINQITQNINLLKQKIDNNEISYYNVNTLTTLCSKAIEFYSAINDDSHLIYLNIMKAVLQREDVQKITTEDK